MPWTPWHFQHCTFWNTSWPALTRSAVFSGPRGDLNRSARLLVLPTGRVVLNPRNQVGTLLSAERPRKPYFDQWKKGSLTEQALWKQCYLDPPEILGANN